MIETLGEPYVTTRANGGRMGDGESSGMGLGFFIAKTLLERSGATINGWPTAEAAAQSADSPSAFTPSSLVSRNLSDIAR